jgi:hypothetical protein
MYTKQEIIDMCAEFTENRITKLSLQKWFDFELQNLINKKRWFWRKKFFTQNLTIGTQSYDLSRTAVTGGTGWADDFFQMISLWLNNSDGSQTEILFTTAQDEVAAMLVNTDTGQPGIYTLKPGTSKTLMFDVLPDTAYSITGHYWATFNRTGDSADDSIPLIPEPFHYVMLHLLLKRMFMYLYGQKDPRYVIAAQDAKDAVADLEAYNRPALGEAVELRTSEARATVRATN